MSDFAPLGYLNLTMHEVDTGHSRYPMIADAMWDGPPVTVLDDTLLRILPDWAIGLDGNLVQIGQYVLRRTGVQNFLMHGEYYHLADSGEVYWLFWRAMQVLDTVWRRLLLTMAVWHLAEWPKEGCYPVWADVKRRWKK